MSLHPSEPHDGSITGRLNWLRAGVLGANDGIVSTAGIVVGVAGATAARQSILVAGIAGLVAGAMSMAAGEYVSVSTQRDSSAREVRPGSRTTTRSPSRRAVTVRVRRALRRTSTSSPLGCRTGSGTAETVALPARSSPRPGRRGRADLRRPCRS